MLLDGLLVRWLVGRHIGQLLAARTPCELLHTPGRVRCLLGVTAAHPPWLFWIDMSVGKDGAIAFAGSTPTQPSEIYYLASPG